MPEWAGLHPLAPTSSVQGALELMWLLGEALKTVTGFDAVSLQPPAGASGELTGLMLMKAYHADRGDLKRNKVIIPDSAHGTNPASIAFAGFEVIEVPSSEDGVLSVEAIRDVIGDDTVGLMITNPNTLGIFESEIVEISRLVREAGGLIYMDGANLNAMMGITRPADMGFDVMHINLHKTFSTPHGGGGPGSGPVVCTEALEPYLPVPVVVKDDDLYYQDWDHAMSIGKIHAFYGNFLVMVRALTYILANGGDGLRRVSEAAILNANYIRVLLQEDFDLPHPERCLHECVFSADRQLKENGVKALDIAKRLLDFGVHAPTVYFPLIVHEAMMIEPTETESKESVDHFLTIMKQIAQEAKDDPELLKTAPHTTPVRRLDEAGAARNPNVCFKPETSD